MVDFPFVAFFVVMELTASVIYGVVHGRMKMMINRASCQGLDG